MRRLLLLTVVTALFAAPVPAAEASHAGWKTCGKTDSGWKMQILDGPCWFARATFRELRQRARADQLHWTMWFRVKGHRVRCDIISERRIDCRTAPRPARPSSEPFYADGTYMHFRHVRP